MFQSTRPHGARRRKTLSASPIPCFNPRARMGRDHRPPVLADARGIVSIHAPAWGATATVGERLHIHLVSIHAPAWGATPGDGPHEAIIRVSIHAPAWGATASGKKLAETAMFQSTRPHGARPARPSRMPQWLQVSIHAPAWGATNEISSALWSVASFQSTRPHGARHLRNTSADCLQRSFNPRARMGRDAPAQPTAFPTSRVSIHAPAWGATTAPCGPVG